MTTRGPKGLKSANVNVRVLICIDLFVLYFCLSEINAHTEKTGLPLDLFVSTQAATVTKTTRLPTTALVTTQTTSARAPSVCSTCGANEKGKLNCCAPGGSWYNNCGAGLNHSWAEGFEVCKRQRSCAHLQRFVCVVLLLPSDQCSHKKTGLPLDLSVSTQAATVTKTTRLPTTALVTTQTTSARAPSVCSTCGANEKGKLNCCAPGGSWYNNCGAGLDHSWAEGSLVCKRQRSYEYSSVCFLFYIFFF